MVDGWSVVRLALAAAFAVMTGVGVDTSHIVVLEVLLLAIALGGVGQAVGEFRKPTAPTLLAPAAGPFTYIAMYTALAAPVTGIGGAVWPAGVALAALFAEMACISAIGMARLRRTRPRAAWIRWVQGLLLWAGAWSALECVHTARPGLARWVGWGAALSALAIGGLFVMLNRESLRRSLTSPAGVQGNS